MPGRAERMSGRMERMPGRVERMSGLMERMSGRVERMSEPRGSEIRVAFLLERKIVFLHRPENELPALFDG